MSKYHKMRNPRKLKSVKNNYKISIVKILRIRNLNKARMHKVSNNRINNLKEINKIKRSIRNF